MKFKFFAAASLLAAASLTMSSSWAQNSSAAALQAGARQQANVASPNGINSATTSHTNIAPTTVAKAASLSIEKSVLGLRDRETDKITPVEQPVFQSGDVIALMLLNVGKFKKGSDGKHRFDMDMEIKNSRNQVIGAKQGLLGEAGHIILPNNIAESPYGSIDTNIKELPAGRYTIKLTIYDKVGGGRATATKSFTMR